MPGYPLASSLPSVRCLALPDCRLTTEQLTALFRQQTAFKHLFIFGTVSIVYGKGWIRIRIEEKKAEFGSALIKFIRSGFHRGGYTDIQIYRRGGGGDWALR